MNKKLKIVTKLATIYIEETYPTEGKYPEIVEHLYQYRKTGTFSGNNVVAIADMHEAMWWNRPLLEDTKAAWGIHTDGLPCCNVPTVFATDRTWKNKYNILVNKNNVPTIIQIKFPKSLTTNSIVKLYSMIFTVISRTLLRLGVNEQDLCQINNDLLLRGKKIVGVEQSYNSDTNIYTGAFFITLKYWDEKELFERLSYGKVPATAKRKITGIIDEYPDITKEEFLKVYCEEFKDYLNQFEF